MNVYVESDSIISPLGFSTSENFKSMFDGISGIKFHEDSKYSSQPFWGSIIDEEKFNVFFDSFDNPLKFSRFERMCLASIFVALKSSEINIKSPRTIIILSTTKGNIDQLDDSEIIPDRTYLWATANLIENYFSSPNKVITVSNACISGVSALITAKRFIESGIYDNAVVCGCDIFSGFVLSGFQSFQAISNLPCKPFDSDRAGLSLGEGCGTVILTNQKSKNLHKQIRISSGSISNDANHISGPSRSGDGLSLSIKNSLSEANLTPDQIDFISAHGTATPYNDEMEALALADSGLINVPVNSLKGYLGHTLGAAGIIESIITIESMRQNIMLKSIGFQNLGASKEINVLKENADANLNHCLKTASGFGGGNAAIVFSGESNEY